MADLLVRGGRLLTPLLNLRADLLIRDGKIERLGRMSQAGAAILDASGCFVLPGFVATHVHLCQTLFRGRADGLPLLRWLRERIWPLEAAHNERSLRASARLGLLELLLGGTTSIVDMGTVHHQDIVFEAMRESGIRGVSGKAMMDRGHGVPRGLREKSRASLDETDDLAKRWHGAESGRLGYAVAPRFILSCSRELLEGAGDLARRRELLLHTHASEHAGECAAVRRATGRSAIEALDALGLTGPRSIFAHCVHTTARERKILARSHTTVAHCPSANLKLGSGMADVVALRQAGARVTLGADGAACNNLLDMWSEMRLAGLIASMLHGPEIFDAKEFLVMATLEGAAAMGSMAGWLEEGRAADLIVVTPGLQTEPASDPLSRLVWSGRASDVRDVIIDGKIVVRNRECLTLDEETVRKEARLQARNLLNRADFA